MLEGAYDAITRVIERRGWSLLIIAAAIGVVMLVSPWRGCSSDFPATTARVALSPDGVYYEADFNASSEQVETFVWVWTEQGPDDVALAAQCRGGEYAIRVTRLPRSIAAPTPSVEWLIDDQPVSSEPMEWRVESTGSYNHALVQEPDRFRALISDADRLTLRFEDEVDGWLELRFPVTGFFETQTQPNLDQCGEY